MAAALVVKWSVKLGIVGGATYLTVKEGLWSTSDESARALKRVRTYVLPEANQYYEKIPSTNDVGHTIGTYWNKGVQNTFQAMDNSPQAIKNYSTKGIEYLKKNFSQ